MEITEVRIKLVSNPSERLRAFCSLTLNGDFVIRDLKIIEGINGVFVAMPSRKLADRCPRCGCKNHLRAKYCNDCGAHLKENRAPKDGQGRAKLHADIAHPINAACRERIQKAIVEAYEAELERSKQPDYRPQTFDDFDDFDMEVGEMEASAAQVSSPAGKASADEHKAVEVGEERLPADEGFGDYNSLVADLKRDAAGRRQSEVETAPNRELRLPPSEGISPMGKPLYRWPAERNAEPAEEDAAEARSAVGKPSRPIEDDDSFGAGL